MTFLLVAQMRNLQKKKTKQTKDKALSADVVI